MRRNTQDAHGKVVSFAPISQQSGSLSSVIASGGVHVAQLPERSLFPPHHRDRREAIEGGPLDHSRAIGQIYQRPVREINHAHDPRLLKNERRLRAKHLGLFGELREINRDRADLPTRDRKAGPVLRHP